MEHAGVKGGSHQVVGSSDGVDVAGEVEVELETTRGGILAPFYLMYFSLLLSLSA